MRAKLCVSIDIDNEVAKTKYNTKPGNLIFLEYDIDTHTGPVSSENMITEITKSTHEPTKT